MPPPPADVRALERRIPEESFAVQLLVGALALAALLTFTTWGWSFHALWQVSVLWPEVLTRGLAPASADVPTALGWTGAVPYATGALLSLLDARAGYWLAKGGLAAPGLLPSAVLVLCAVPLGAGFGVWEMTRTSWT